MRTVRIGSSKRGNVIPIVSIVGHHDSGKTRLITQLIPILVARGLRVGTVKHAPHLERIDVPGSDSAVHLKSGATRVLLRAEETSALFWPHHEKLATDIDRLFAGCDLVLVEGDKRGPFPKIEVFRRGLEVAREPLAGEVDVAGVVTEERVALPDGVEVFSPHEGERIADFIETMAFGDRE